VAVCLLWQPEAIVILFTHLWFNSIISSIHALQSQVLVSEQLPSTSTTLSRTRLDAPVPRSLYTTLARQHVRFPVHRQGLELHRLNQPDREGGFPDLPDPDKGESRREPNPSISRFDFSTTLILRQPSAFRHLLSTWGTGERGEHLCHLPA